MNDKKEIIEEAFKNTKTLIDIAEKIITNIIKGLEETIKSMFEDLIKDINNEE